MKYNTKRSASGNVVFFRWQKLDQLWTTQKIFIRFYILREPLTSSDNLTGPCHSPYTNVTWQRAPRKPGCLCGLLRINPSTLRTDEQSSSFTGFSVESKLTRNQRYSARGALTPESGFGRDLRAVQAWGLLKKFCLRFSLHKINYLKSSKVTQPELSKIDKSKTWATAAVAKECALEQNQAQL